MRDRDKHTYEIKYVFTLYIKIFEFNSKNYDKKNLTSIRTNANNDGLTALYE